MKWKCDLKKNTYICDENYDERESTFSRLLRDTPSVLI